MRWMDKQAGEYYKEQGTKERSKETHEGKGEISNQGRGQTQRSKREEEEKLEI